MMHTLIHAHHKQTHAHTHSFTHAHNTHSPSMGKLKGILSGKTPIDLYLHFLYSHSKVWIILLF